LNLRMKSPIKKFGEWYRNNMALNRAIVAVLFGWQLLHLFWLTTNVVAYRLLGHAFFDPNEIYRLLLVIADYFEIPALVSGTLLYFYSLKESSAKRSWLFIILINSQWMHLFWITDEFVSAHFRGAHSYFPVWLIWAAILIDYLELPVIYDTIKKTGKNILKKSNL